MADDLIRQPYQLPPSVDEHLWPRSCIKCNQLPGWCKCKPCPRCGKHPNDCVCRATRKTPTNEGVALNASDMTYEEMIEAFKMKERRI